VLDVDKLGHQAIEAERDAIIARFGESVADGTGAVDRRALGERVFGRPEALAALEALVHPAANRMTEEWIAGLGAGACVINAALLHRCSVFQRLRCVILMKAPFLIRLLRARRRDHLPWGALLRRFAGQREFNAQYCLQNADIHIVWNSGVSAHPGLYRRRKLEQRIHTILSREGI
jgi:dephospho-CoA kinase